MATPLGGWVPIFHVADAAVSGDFYAQFGFAKQWEHQFEPGFPKFVCLARGDLKLFVSEHEGDGGRRGQLYLYVDDVDAFREELVGRGLEVPPPRDQPWGCREIELTDSDGHRFRVGTQLAERRGPHTGHTVG